MFHKGETLHQTAPKELWFDCCNCCIQEREGSFANSFNQEKL